MKEGEGGGEQQGRGLRGRAAAGGGALGALHEELRKLSVSCACSCCAVREVGEEGRRKERRKENKEKIWKIF
jgi:hypothetical protein